MGLSLDLDSGLGSIQTFFLDWVEGFVLELAFDEVFFFMSSAFVTLFSRFSVLRIILIDCGDLYHFDSDTDRMKPFIACLTTNVNEIWI